MLAAELDGRVAGILIGRVAADEFEILNLAVGETSRRRGVATQLVSAALEFARTSGARQAYLEVRASNEGGIAFYTRLGFQVCGRRPIIIATPWRMRSCWFFTIEESARIILLIYTWRVLCIVLVGLSCNTPFTNRIAQEAHYADLDSGDTRATSDI